jgi:hypothetical protein
MRKAANRRCSYSEHIDKEVDVNNSLRTLRRSQFHIVIFVFVLTGLLTACIPMSDHPVEMTKNKRRSGEVLRTVVSASPNQPVELAAPTRSGFAGQTRLGFTAGQQWEPAIEMPTVGTGKPGEKSAVVATRKLSPPSSEISTTGSWARNVR